MTPATTTGRSKPPSWYWEQGQRAQAMREKRRERGETATNAELAECLGLGSETNVRQAIKFRMAADKSLAEKFDAAGVPWRFIFNTWLCLKKPERNKLTKHLLAKRSEPLNSNKLRRYTAEHFGKEMRPRLPSEFSEASDTVQTKAAKLTALLAGYEKLCEQQTKVSANSQLKAVRTQLRKLARTLEQTCKTITHVIRPAVRR